jgi:mannose-1-phosphate guanylyltransferase
VALERTLVVVTQAHERYYGPALAGAPPETVVVQPANRGTAPAILYALLRLEGLAPGSPMVLLPSDHWVADDDAFMACVEGALEAVLARPDLVVLLGVAPDRAETAYGWIEPAEPIVGSGAWPLFRVRRFWEKPSQAVAARLAAEGALWNSFVIAARPATARHLIRTAIPAPAEAFPPLAARGCR